VRANRRFHLIDEEGRLVNGKVAGTLVQVAATADGDGTTLSLRFPDGAETAAEVELGDAVATAFYGRPVAGRLVGGPFAEALSSFAGRTLRLVRVGPGEGCDRGADGCVSIVSRAGLDALAREAGVERVDGRRFRMLFELDGVSAHEEDEWVGRQVALGQAIVRVHAHVGRCVVTAQDPDTGVKNLDTLRTIRRYRSHVESDEPLPVGVWGAVERPGRVRVGDPVGLL
jgi:uncharacterized protein YcbX